MSVLDKKWTISFSQYNLIYIFQAVMRICCTRGLALHTFHGNFFVRSTGKNPKIPVFPFPKWGILNSQKAWQYTYNPIFLIYRFVVNDTAEVSKAWKISLTNIYLEPNFSRQITVESTFKFCRHWGIVYNMISGEVLNLSTRKFWNAWKLEIQSNNRN